MQNLRELIDSRGLTQTYLAKALGIKPEAMTRRVDGRMALRVAECRILAQALHVTMEAIVDAATETERRPGEGDARGRKSKTQSLGGEKKNGETIQVGLGSTGHGALAPHV